LDADDDYDVAPFSGHGVFIVTVGCGATRGYRFWDGSGEDFLGGVPRTVKPVFSNAIETQTAAASGLFGNAETFRALRAQERILWFRVRWVPNVGGGLDSSATMDNQYTDGGVGANGLVTNWNDKKLYHLLTNSPAARVVDKGLYRITREPGTLAPQVRQAGSIEWIQRLEQEPPRW
jgi:hypothetical protein